MWLSQVKNECELTDSQLTKLVFDNVTMLSGNADVALLLGGSPDAMDDRTPAAARLYHDGKVKYICPTGGVKWHTKYGELSECEYMTRLLVDMGVPSDVIIAENEANTTIENMIYGTLRIQRALRFDNVKSIVVVSSNSHLRRSEMLGKMFLPSTVAVSCYPCSNPYAGREKWSQKDEYRKRVLTEARLILSLLRGGQIEDIEL